MKKIIFLGVIALGFSVNANSQPFKETFDANSLEWTECAFESSNGSAIIDKGKMTVVSKGEKSVLGQVVGENTFFETHCYAPLNVQKPFKIKSHVNIKKLSPDRMAGLVFNYRDGGNFYCFAFNDEMVTFLRFVDNECVGAIQQGIIWRDKKKVDQEWELTSDGQVLSFVVDGMLILKVKYMPLEYSGFGYYTFGKQELIVDDVEFIQL